MAAGTTGYTPEFIKKNEEIMTNSLLYDLVNQMYLNSNSQDEAPKDKIFAAESKVVRELAEKGNWRDRGTVCRLCSSKFRKLSEGILLSTS